MTTHTEHARGIEEGLVWLTDYVREVAAGPGETPDGVKNALWVGGLGDLVPLDCRDDGGSYGWDGAPAGRVAYRILFGPHPLDDDSGDGDLQFRRTDLDAVLGRVAEEVKDSDAALGRNRREQVSGFAEKGAEMRKRDEEIFWDPLIEECLALKKRNPSLSISDASRQVSDAHPGVNANTLRRKPKLMAQWPRRVR
jgi:hypothetical protein